MPLIHALTPLNDDMLLIKGKYKTVYNLACSNKHRGPYHTIRDCLMPLSSLLAAAAKSKGAAVIVPTTILEMITPVLSERVLINASYYRLVVF